MRRKRTKISRKTAWTKVRLTLPDLDQAKAAVLRSLRSPESQRGYRHAIDEFIAWYCSEPRLSFNRAEVSRYKADLESRQLAPGTVTTKSTSVDGLQDGLEGGDLSVAHRTLGRPNKKQVGYVCVSCVRNPSIGLNEKLTSRTGNFGCRWTCAILRFGYMGASPSFTFTLSRVRLATVGERLTSTPEAP